MLSDTPFYNLNRWVANFVGLAVAMILGGGDVNAQNESPQSYFYQSPMEAPKGMVSQVPGRAVLGDVTSHFSGSLGSGISYDSNLFQDPEGEVGGAIFTSDLALTYQRGQEKRRGLFFNAGWDLAYFRYDNEELSRGREPFEQSFDGSVGIRGAKTTITANAAFAKNNGNAINQERIQRETLRSVSNQSSFGFNAERRLKRDIVSFRANYAKEEFEAGSTGRTDTSNSAYMVSFRHRPLLTPKIDLNFGAGFGSSEQDGGVRQEYVNPSVGATYRYSQKTSFFANAGLDFRTSESTTTVVTPAVVTPAVVGPDGVVTTPAMTSPATTSTVMNSFDQTSPTYGAGVSWSPNERTSLTMSLNRSTQASALQGQSSSDTTRLSLAGNRQLSRGYYVSASYSLEDSAYTNGAGIESLGGGIENYHRFGCSIGRQIQLRPNVGLNVSAFYQFNAASATDPLEEFEQSLVGIRVGLSF